ncbi:hypothetical protein EJC49_09215 [Aquibium carbonis]|uniref:Uncharacterized protein n=1 Tax=Aquibium carbonis TaxID=2495581 RepID=A0A429YYZ5_9HYPH|nr:DUF6105 family protein [Aquibium carbonis]RST86643.1 hypothetical protein EJC49_09215 [Aquibium carbonis]
MRYIILFWALPMGLFWSWFGLSYHDIHFGQLFFSRVLHDEVFRLYGDILGLDPSILPGMVARACIVDTVLIFGILAFRRRKSIGAWMRERRRGPAVQDVASPSA